MPSIFIATPVYGAPTQAHQQALLNTIPVLEKAGLDVHWKVLEGCCYVHLARNKLVRDFLVSGCTDLLFIDADIAWEPDQMVRLCQREEEIVGAAAPFRMGTPGFPVHALTDDTGRPLVDPKTGLIEVDVLPTAVMKIKRKAFFDMVREKQAPLRIEYANDGTERERYLSFFDFETNDDLHIEFGEDVTFCRKWRRIGGKLWLEPDMTIKHYGFSHREGNYHDWLRALPGGGGETPAHWEFKPRSSAA